MPKYRVSTYQTYLSRRFYEVEARDTAEARHLASLNEIDPYSSRIDPDGEERIVEIRIMEDE